MIKYILSFEHIMEFIKTQRTESLKQLRWKRREKKGVVLMTIGYTTGVYDLFHIVHLNLLKNA